MTDFNVNESVILKKGGYHVLLENNFLTEMNQSGQEAVIYMEELLHRKLEPFLL